MSSTNGGHRPAQDDLAALSWLVSRRVWAGTLVFAALLLLSIAGLAPLYFGADAVEAVRRVAVVPAALLAVFLAARALSMLLVQQNRDQRIQAGRKTAGADVSVVGMVTVASFSTLGLLATAVAVPFLVTVSGTVHLVAVGVAVLVVPITYPLQIHQLTEKASADRQRRGYRVSPAVWTFLWTLPIVVLVWFLAVSHPPVPVYVPETVAGVTVRSSLAGRTILVEAWHLGFAVICTPTVLVGLYVGRRTVSAVVRGVTP